MTEGERRERAEQWLLAQLADGKSGREIARMLGGTTNNQLVNRPLREWRRTGEMELRGRLLTLITELLDGTESGGGRNGAGGEEAAQPPAEPSPADEMTGEEGFAAPGGVKPVVGNPDVPQVETDAREDKAGDASPSSPIGTTPVEQSTEEATAEHMSAGGTDDGTADTEPASSQPEDDETPKPVRATGGMGSNRRRNERRAREVERRRRVALVEQVANATVLPQLTAVLAQVGNRLLLDEYPPFGSPSSVPTERQRKQVLAAIVGAPVLRLLPMEQAVEVARLQVTGRLTMLTAPEDLGGDALRMLLSGEGGEMEFEDEGALAVAFGVGDETFGLETPGGLYRWGLGTELRQRRYAWSEHFGRPALIGGRESGVIRDAPYRDEDWFFGSAGWTDEDGKWRPGRHEVIARWRLLREMYDAFGALEGQEVWHYALYEARAELELTLLGDSYAMTFDRLILGVAAWPRSTREGFETRGRAIQIEANRKRARQGGKRRWRRRRLHRLWSWMGATCRRMVLDIRLSDAVVAGRDGSDVVQEENTPDAAVEVTKTNGTAVDVAKAASGTEGDHRNAVGMGDGEEVDGADDVDTDVDADAGVDANANAAADAEERNGRNDAARDGKALRVLERGCRRGGLLALVNWARFPYLYDEVERQGWFTRKVSWCLYRRHSELDGSVCGLPGDRWRALEPPLAPEYMTPTPRTGHVPSEAFRRRFRPHENDPDYEPPEPPEEKLSWWRRGFRRKRARAQQGSGEGDSTVKAPSVSRWRRLLGRGRKKEDPQSRRADATNDTAVAEGPGDGASETRTLDTGVNQNGRSAEDEHTAVPGQPQAGDRG